MNKKIYYGWFVVLACMFLNAIGTGVSSSIFGMFFPPIVKEFGYSQAAVAGIISVSIIAGILSTGMLSKLYQKYSIRKLVLIFGIGAGLAYIAMSKTNNLISMYIVSGFIGVLGMGATALSAPMLITNWFKDKRGTAMGLAVAGAGLGPGLMAPIITRAIEKGGYRLGFFVLGIIVLVSMVISFLLIKDKPEDIGLKAYEDFKGDEGIKEKGVAKEQYNYTVKEAMRTQMFYGFGLFIIVICIVVQGLLLQIPSYLNAIGFSTTRVGLIISMYAFMASLGKVTIGWTYDRIGIFKGNFIFFTLMIVAFFALIISTSVPSAIYLYVICGGLGLGLTSIVVPLLVSFLFGSKHYSTLYPIFMIMMSFGAIIGGVITGSIIDTMGYGALLNFGIAGALLAFILIQITLKVSEKASVVMLEKQ